MKKRTDTYIKEQAPTFEELEAAWRRHKEHVERLAREQAPGRDEATARLARWYAGQRRHRRAQVMQTALAACLVVGVSAVAWQAAPAPRLTAFNTFSPAVAREASTLSIYMLDHE